VIFNGFGIDARQVYEQQELAGLFVNVDRRQPGAGVGRGGERRAEQPIDILLQAIDERPGS
jgi:hypothetical protein